MKLTYYGHACFAVELGGKTLLFDPFITPNEMAKSIDIDQVPAHFILLSHGHADHVADAVAIAKRTGAQVIAAFEVAQWLGGQGLENVHAMNHGGAYSFDFVRVKMVSAIHSSVLPDGTYGGNPAGFVVTGPEGGFYYSGDTALTLDMKLIAEEFTDLKFAVLPIGDNFTMGAAEAGKAAQFSGCPAVVGVHYDTFPPIKIDHAAAKATFDQARLPLHLPGIGESLEL